MSDTDPTTTTPVYDLSSVSRTFKNGPSVIKAVDGISLEIGSGEFVAIEGPSGSGKSTLLQLLGGLDRPTDGELLLDGSDVRKMGEKSLTELRRSTVGFVFQSFNLVPTLNALENVEAAMAPFRMSRRERRERATELLASVGLAGRGDHLPSRLSGGEQQRVAIARARANRPRVLLADEPTGNLDSRTSAEVVDLLGRLVADQGVTVVIVTHEEDVARRATRRIRLRDGQIDTGWAA
jgi:putative ABC transport system ATP-binding protein